jgi:hypothetical protein
VLLEVIWAAAIAELGALRTVTATALWSDPYFCRIVWRLIVVVVALT